MVLARQERMGPQGGGTAALVEADFDGGEVVVAAGEGGRWSEMAGT